MTADEFTKQFKVGDRITFAENPRKTDIFRIMAIAEGYVMGRYTGCMVFAKNIADFAEDTKWRKLEGR